MSWRLPQEEIYQWIIQVLVASLNVVEEAVSWDTKLRDLGVEEPLGVLALRFDVGRVFGLHRCQFTLEEVSTVGDLVNYVALEFAMTQLSLQFAKIAETA